MEFKKDFTKRDYLRIAIFFGRELSVLRSKENTAWGCLDRREERVQSYRMKE